MSFKSFSTAQNVHTKKQSEKHGKDVPGKAPSAPQADKASADSAPPAKS